MNEVARAKKRLADTKLAAAKAQQEIMKLLQTQHSQIQQLQVCCGILYLLISAKLTSSTQELEELWAVKSAQF